MIDPWISNPNSPITVDDIKFATMILVTHDHFDHLGETLAIAAKTEAMVVATCELTGKLIQQGLPQKQTVYDTGLG